MADGVGPAALLRRWRADRLPRGRWWLSVVLWIGAAFAAAARAELLVVIAPAEHAAARLSLAELNLVFKRKRLFWPGGQGRIQPANLPARDPTRQRFSELVLGARPEALDGYWNEQYFQGIRPPHVVPSAAAMRRFIVETRHAIGYLAGCPAPDPALTVLGWFDRAGAWHRGAPPDCAIR